MFRDELSHDGGHAEEVKLGLRGSWSDHGQRFGLSVNSELRSTFFAERIRMKSTSERDPIGIMLSPFFPRYQDTPSTPVCFSPPITGRKLRHRYVRM